MQKKHHKKKIIITVCAVLCVHVLFFSDVFSETESVTINATVPAICGNGVTEGDEECDEGAQNGGAVCSAICQNVVDNGGGGGDAGGGDAGGGDAGGGDAGGGDAGGGDAGGGDAGGGAGGQENNGGGEFVPQGVIAIQDIDLWAKEKTIKINTQDRTPSVLFAQTLIIEIREDSIPDSELLDSLVINDGGVIKRFTFRQTDSRYYTQIQNLRLGENIFTITAYYNQGGRKETTLLIQGNPYGQVTDGEAVVAGVNVTLYEIVGGNEIIVDATKYHQQNPTQTNPNGIYGFIVPNGRYKIVASKQGYRDRITPSFSVINNTINTNISLIKKAPALSDVFDPNASVTENIANIAKNISEKTIEQLKVTKEKILDAATIIQEVADNPIVEKVTKNVVAPSAVGISVLAVTPSLWSIVFPLLRFLFLQPLLIIGKRKREGWGIVYNSNTKLPIDLAMVRLINVQTKKVVQSRVTDKNGRYLFTLEPGKYILEVQKSGFAFPSSLLSGVQSDGRKLDIYHGEEITVNEDDTDITPNIPLDPSGVTKTPKRIIWEKRLRILQHAISIIGIVTTLAALYINPSALIAGFLVIHIVIFVGFIRYVKPKKPKQWGIVYEEHTKKPIGKAVARLFTKKYNKLVATQVTDNKGRYAFLVGPNEYYVTYDKTGYGEQTSSSIQIEDEKEGIISKDIGLDKK